MAHVVDTIDFYNYSHRLLHSIIRNIDMAMRTPTFVPAGYSVFNSCWIIIFATRKIYSRLFQSPLTQHSSRIWTSKLPLWLVSVTANIKKHCSKNAEAGFLTYLAEKRREHPVTWRCEIVCAQGPYSLPFLSLKLRLRLWFETQTLEIRIH